ncbi:MAG: outer membrane beta-barrel protein [Cyclobacteriaceae bacterium]|jgi:hypothetical protein|nr:outer membrane beta-barrel protein [Flammeovirgaceae bacterium]MCZ8022807.1 outer membrane beta-barrel protein [Cytophagales bacterium]MCZ8327623.1 outer membrane beta-barrel protein [Cyclobacteriaceae bacterium]
MRKPTLIILSLLTLLPIFSFGQSFYALRRDRDLVISAGTGVTKFYGDLVNPNDFGKARLNINIGAEYFLGRRISARTDLTWFQLAGDDALANSDRVTRNLSFFSNNLEWNITGAIQLIPNGKKFYQRPGLNFYAFGGIGLLYTNPKARYNGETVALQPLQTEGVKYNRVQFVIPMGFGVKYKVNPWFNIAVEGCYRETFTDYLDDVSSRRYPDPSTLSSPLAIALSDRRKEYNPSSPLDFTKGVRGNPENEDAYFIITVKGQFYVPWEFANSKKLYKSKRKAYYNRPKRGLFGNKGYRPRRR